MRSERFEPATTLENFIFIFSFTSDFPDIFRITLEK
jgi:hypothetical protein